MGDILKEAIADAKAVRETALANAKMALEEAFTPQLKSMLSAKLREEDDELEGGEEEFGDEEEAPADEEEFGGEEEGDEEEIPAEEGSYDEQDEEGGEEEFGDEEEVEEEGLELEDIIRELESELSEEELGEEEEPVDETIEVNGIKYAPISEQEEEEGEEEPEVEEESYELDDSILEQEDEEEDEEPVEEQSSSSNIGKGDNAVDVADGKDEEDPQGGAVVTGVKMESVQAELHEYKEAVKFLKGKLHEVNILNAKLLFTNKLFKEFALDNNQKLKVVETFDRAQSTREIKLVYSTLAEQFGDNGSITRKSIKESASAKSGSTKPSKKSTKVISEENQVANRFRKLAGILKG